MALAPLRSRLLRWYLANRRDLPWRATGDPYAIWVSEIMLQQTRVDVVIPYFERWMARFPTLAALANAGEEEVLQAWSGLGYYSRARNLWNGAKQVIAYLGGTIPRDPDGLQKLAGVGPYTSAAIASIAFGFPAAVVDGNVERVITRLYAITGNPKTGPTKQRIVAEAQSLLDRHRAGDWNQAMMELGATVCLPRNPLCNACPVAAACSAKQSGTQANYPQSAAAPAVRTEQHRYAVVQKRGKVLLVRNSSKGLLSGMWLLPGGKTTNNLPQLVHEQTGIKIQVRPKPATVVHKFSHRTWRMRIHHTEIAAARAAKGSQETRWAPVKTLHEEALPAAMKHALNAAGVPVKAKRPQTSAGAP